MAKDSTPADPVRGGVSLRKTILALWLCAGGILWADILPHHMQGDIRTGTPLRSIPDAFAADPAANHWPRPCKRGQVLSDGETIHLAAQARLEWRSLSGQLSVLRGPARAVVSGEGVQLLDGTLWQGRGAEPEYSLAWLPAPPTRGRIVRLSLESRTAFSSIELFTLPGREKTSLHPDPARAGQRRASALFALARNDWRREVRLELKAVSAEGSLTRILTLPVLAAADTPLDTSGIFGRRGYIQPLWAWRPAPAFFPYQARVLLPSERVAWRDRKTATAGFPPWSTATGSQGIWLPPDKQALLADQAGIQRENAIHWQATSWDTAETLWSGPFIIPAWQRYSSPFSESRTFVGLGTGVHLGIDIASFFGTAVAAPNSGIVRFAGKTTLCGNNIIIDHGRRVFTKIMHLDSLFVASGQRVERGQPVGMTGTSGLSTGPHIHWEMLVGGVRVDPEDWVALREGGLQ